MPRGVRRHVERAGDADAQHPRLASDTCPSPLGHLASSWRTNTSTGLTVTCRILDCRAAGRVTIAGATMAHGEQGKSLDGGSRAEGVGRRLPHEQASTVAGHGPDRCGGDAPHTRGTRLRPRRRPHAWLNCPSVATIRTPPDAPGAKPATRAAPHGLFWPERSISDACSQADVRSWCRGPLSPSSSVEWVVLERRRLCL